jgi:hypothetical protein
MSIRSRLRGHPLGAALVLGAVAVILTGCTPSTPPPTSTPTPTESAPIFASDEEALAAAVEAYEAYLETSGEITADSGANPERIAPFVAESYLPEVLKSYQNFSRNSLRSSGTSSIDTVSLSQVTDRDGGIEVQLHLCHDVTATRILNANGDDVTPPDRQNRLPLEVEFESTEASSNHLVVSSSELWPGDDFC